jgi:hypothetical protein
MTIRTLFAITLTASLATACVVAGEEDPTLEELESRTGSEIDVDKVALYRDGKPVSYSSLTALQQEGLHATLDAFEAEWTRHEGIIPECEFGTSGWACWNDFVDCGCQYAPSGWKCYCDFDP